MPYTRPIGNGLRVSARLTTTPEKKNGAAMTRASSSQITTVVKANREVGTSVTCSASPITADRANAVLKVARSYERVFEVKREPFR